MAHRLLAAVETPIEELSGKVVHHRNGVRCDNRLENLEVMERGEHTAHHNTERPNLS